MQDPQSRIKVYAKQGNPFPWIREERLAWFPEIDRECVQISHNYSVSLWTQFSWLAEDPYHNNVIVLIWIIYVF